LERVPLSYFWSTGFLLSRPMLWCLFWVNFLGTVYGYIWYGEQIRDTVANKPLWMVLYVPDSPTASLFFTVSVLFMLFRKRDDQIGGTQGSSLIRSAVDTIGAVTSVKYGVWAVAVIQAAHVNGGPLAWQDWMLSISHLGMAAEALLYARFLSFRPFSLCLAALWVFSNDWLDYRFGIFPWLPTVLMDKLGTIQLWTILLSGISLLVFVPFLLRRSKMGVTR
jgi:uncharacterized membrane protein YpjA